MASDNVNKYIFYSNGVKTDCVVKEQEICFTSENREESVLLEDIIGLEADESPIHQLLCVVSIHTIQKLENEKLQDKIMRFDATLTVFKQLKSHLNTNMSKVLKRPKSLLVLINAVGGSKDGEKQYKTMVAPLFQLAEIKTDVIVSERPKHFVEIMDEYDISELDGIVLCGGDGTVNECIRSLFSRVQQEAGIDINDTNAKLKPLPFPITQIPTGTGNGLTKMSTGVADITTSALHIIKGAVKHYNILGVYSDNKWISCYAILFMFGIWSDMIDFMDKHRWLGRTRYFFLPMFHLFCRQHPVYKTEITLYRPKIENDSDSTTSSANQNADIIHEDIVNLLMLTSDGFTDDFRFNRQRPRVANYDRTVVCLYKLCSRFDIVKQFFQAIFALSEYTFVKDFIRNERVTGAKIKIKNPEVTDQHEVVVNVDGEIMKLWKPEFEVRLLGRFLPVFSSRNIRT